jgi:hypothetical protein
MWESHALGRRVGTGVLCNGVLLLARGAHSPPPGVVWYALTARNLQAVWTHGNMQGFVGTGLAVRDDPISLPGRWLITYYDPKGNSSAPLYLEITEEGGVFDLSWRREPAGPPAFAGVGLPSVIGLTAAWDHRSDGHALSLDILPFTVEGPEGLCATATWATWGHSRTGCETINRLQEP